jgi:hypothetical protein
MSGTTVTGWHFRGTNADGTITSVVIRADKLKVKGRRGLFGYTLDEPMQGRVGVTLQFGSGAAYCAAAPAKASGTPPSTAKYDHVDLFIAQPRTPAPTRCPPPP